MRLAPTGGRTMTAALLDGRRQSIAADRSVSRKELSAAARDAVQALNLRPALRLVLDELVGVYGEQEVQGRILVWPSNEYLMDRTGLSERAVRYLVRDLINEGIITARDSANGKRYARRAPSGEVIDAYGFDLTPLYAKRGQWVEMIAARNALRETLKRAFDEVTICRRAVSEALSALAQHFPDIDTTEIEREEAMLNRDTPRRGRGDPRSLVDRWISLRNKVEEVFYQAGKASIPCRHKETNNDSTGEACTKSLPEEAGARVQFDPMVPLVAEACPVAGDYGFHVRSAADIVAAGRYLRGTLGAHPNAWDEAAEALGPIAAGAVVLYVLQVHTNDIAKGENRIRNPGGYFRAMVRMVSDNKVKLDEELRALRRRMMT